MSQNQLITLLLVVLLLVVAASAFILLGPMSGTDSTIPSPSTQAPAQSHFQLDILEQQAYKLLNKQLVKEGALPVQPSATAGKANPFL